jgi:hypothetical protein
MNIWKWILDKINLPLDFIAQLLMNVFPGLKTFAVGIGAVIVGVYNVIATPENIKSLCNLGVICLEGNQAWGLVTGIFGLLAIIVRKSSNLKSAASSRPDKK